MSTRTFIISVLAIFLSVGAYILWTNHEPVVNPKTEKPELVNLSDQHDRIQNNQESLNESRFSSLLDSSLPWESRTISLRELDKGKLGQEEVNELFELLRHQPEANLKESWYVTVNEIMEQMRIQGIGSERYTDSLINIIRIKR